MAHKDEPVKYRVLTGMNYPPERRAEVGDIVTDIPDFAIKKLLHNGDIEVVHEGDK